MSRTSTEPDVFADLMKRLREPNSSQYPNRDGDKSGKGSTDDPDVIEAVYTEISGSGGRKIPPSNRNKRNSSEEGPSWITMVILLLLTTSVTCWIWLLHTAPKKVPTELVSTPVEPTKSSPVVTPVKQQEIVTANAVPSTSYVAPVKSLIVYPCTFGNEGVVGLPEQGEINYVTDGTTLRFSGTGCMRVQINRARNNPLSIVSGKNFFMESHHGYRCGNLARFIEDTEGESAKGKRATCLEYLNSFGGDPWRLSVNNGTIEIR